MDDPLGTTDIRRGLAGVVNELITRRLTKVRFQRKASFNGDTHGPVLVIMLEESWNLAADGARANRVALRRTQRATEPSRKEPTL